MSSEAPDAAAEAEAAYARFMADLAEEDAVEGEQEEEREERTKDQTTYAVHAQATYAAPATFASAVQDDIDSPAPGQAKALDLRRRGPAGARQANGVGKGEKGDEGDGMAKGREEGERQRRRDGLEREEQLARLEDETRAQQDADRKVLAFKERLQAIKDARSAKRSG